MRRAALLILLLTTQAWADQATLSPPGTTVDLRTYGLGFLPLDGNFTRFHGVLRYEPANPAVCQVVLAIEASSLAMGNHSIRETITGPDSMDVAHYPDLTFEGGCQGDRITGQLTLHGQTHPFALDLDRSARTIVATGRLTRADWGLTGHPLLGGPVIRMRIEIPSPFQGPHT
jgi:polyisoprenoid-binding protein YceI